MSDLFSLWLSLCARESLCVMVKSHQERRYTSNQRDKWVITLARQDLISSVGCDESMACPPSAFFGRIDWTPQSHSAILINNMNLEALSWKFAFLVQETLKLSLCILIGNHVSSAPPFLSLNVQTLSWMKFDNSRNSLKVKIALFLFTFKYYTVEFTLTRWVKDKK